MAFTPKDWRNLPETSTPISAEALEDMEARLSGHTDSGEINALVSREAPINPLHPEYGAVGDDSANDTDAVQEAFTRAGTALGGKQGEVILPGMFRAHSALSVPDGVHIRGPGMRSGAGLRKMFAGNLLQFHGEATSGDGSTHNRYCSVSDLDLLGNDNTGPLMSAVYCNNLRVERVFGFGNIGSALDAVELWDSYILDNVFEWCSGASTGLESTLRFRNSSAASGFGFGADNTNEIHIERNRIESWRDGAVRVGAGTSNTQPPNGFYIRDNKVESYVLRGKALSFDGFTQRVWLKGLYLWMGGFDSGFSTAQDAIEWLISSIGTMEDVLIGNAAVATVRAGVHSWTTGRTYLDGIRQGYTTAPTVAHIEHAGGPRPVVTGATNELQTVASAATLTIPLGAEVVKVTGSTTITNITAGYPSQRVLIVWDTGATFDITDGGNLRLASNITAADADDAVELFCDGTNWHQASPVSAN